MPAPDSKDRSHTPAASSDSVRNGQLQPVADALKGSADLIERSLQANSDRLELLYLQSVCKEELITSGLLLPFIRHQGQESGLSSGYMAGMPNASLIADTDGGNRVEQAVRLLLLGHAVVAFNGVWYSYSCAKTEASGIQDASKEKSVFGSKDALSEDIEANLTLIRTRYRHPNLTMETFRIGTLSQTQVIMLYDKSKADHLVPESIRNRIHTRKSEMITSDYETAQLITGQSVSLFPTMLTTERPDRIVKSLSEGGVCILTESSPGALLAPAVFHDFIWAIDDNLSMIYRVFFALLRYMGLFISTTLPAFYVAITSYNPEIFRVQLTLMIAGSRAAVPYPSFLEVLFMLVMMEFLIEASVRLPKTIGQTATTVGGLILGQAATEAGLIGTIMIIIVAAVAISNFVIPIQQMGLAFRLLKFPLILLAALFGVFGVVIGVIALILYLASIRSFGRPYLQLFR